MQFVPDDNIADQFRPVFTASQTRYTRPRVVAPSQALHAIQPVIITGRGRNTRYVAAPNLHDSSYSASATSAPYAPAIVFVPNVQLAYVRVPPTSRPQQYSGAVQQQYDTTRGSAYPASSAAIPGYGGAVTTSYEGGTTQTSSLPSHSPQFTETTRGFFETLTTTLPEFPEYTDYPTYDSTTAETPFYELDTTVAPIMTTSDYDYFESTRVTDTSHTSTAGYATDSTAASTQTETYGSFGTSSAAPLSTGGTYVTQGPLAPYTHGPAPTQIGATATKQYPRLPSHGSAPPHNYSPQTPQINEPYTLAFAGAVTDNNPFTATSKPYGVPVDAIVNSPTPIYPHLPSATNQPQRYRGNGGSQPINRAGYISAAGGSLTPTVGSGAPTGAEAQQPWTPNSLLPPAMFEFIFGPPTNPAKKRCCPKDKVRRDQPLPSRLAVVREQRVRAITPVPAVRQERLNMWRRWQRWRKRELIAPGSAKLQRFVNTIVNTRHAILQRRRGRRLNRRV